MVSAARLYTQILDQALSQGVVPSAERGSGSMQAAENVMRLTSEIIGTADDPNDMRRKVGAAFLNMTPTSDESRRALGATVAARIPSHDWPERPVLIAAVDAQSGEPVVFDRHSDVDLVGAVAATTANGWAYRIGDKGFIDGGYRRNENADLAGGYGRVLVLSPFGGRSWNPLEWRMPLAAQVDELPVAGSSVTTILPDRESEPMFGANAMDLALRPAAAQAGYA